MYLIAYCGYYVQDQGTFYRFFSSRTNTPGITDTVVSSNPATHASTPDWQADGLLDVFEHAIDALGAAPKDGYVVEDRSAAQVRIRVVGVGVETRGALTLRHLDLHRDSVGVETLHVGPGTGCALVSWCVNGGCNAGGAGWVGRRPTPNCARGTFGTHVGSWGDETLDTKCVCMGIELDGGESSTLKSDGILRQAGEGCRPDGCG